MVYIQWNMDVPAFSFSKVGVIDATFRTLTVRDKTWTEHRIPVTQLRDWSKEHLSLEPGPVEVFLIAVDSHSNRYFSLYWNENVKNNLKPKSHYDLFKLSPDDKLIWYLPDTPLQLLDVSPSSSLIVSENDPTNRTTDIIKGI